MNRMLCVSGSVQRTTTLSTTPVSPVMGHVQSVSQSGIGTVRISQDALMESPVLHLSLENVTLVSWRCQSRALAEVSRLRHARQYKLSASSIWAVKFLHYANTYCDMPLLLQFLKKIHDFNFSCEAVQPMALWRTFIL